MLRRQMSIQSGRLHKRLSADVTLELLYSQVNPLVVVEIRRPPEPLSAHIALEHLARLVLAHVRHVLDLLVERLIAQVAAEFLVRP